RTVRTTAIIFAITFCLNGAIALMGEAALTAVFRNVPVVGELIAAAVGLIPNCAASILISQLYLSGVIGAGAMMSGLLVSAGVGMLVLFEENRNLKENFAIVGILYAVSVIWGVLTEAFGIVF
ncbi:MAG: arsenic efflux protein, partial [Eubacterium sp.]|nr:arsenic efflux protein [Eubacterium sp.]